MEIVLLPVAFQGIRKKQVQVAERIESKTVGKAKYKIV
jgi:hypothetical protein